MPDKREVQTAQIDDYRQQVHDYFFSHSSYPEKRTYYEERGLTFTNNLYLWFNDNAEDWGPGLKNPYDYRHKPFGPFIHKLREEHPGLWKEVIETSYMQKAISAFYNELLESNEPETVDELQAINDRVNERRRDLRERSEIAKSRAFDILAPQVAEAGIDPVTLCI